MKIKKAIAFLLSGFLLLQSCEAGVAADLPEEPDFIDEASEGWNDLEIPFEIQDMDITRAETNAAENAQEPDISFVPEETQDQDISFAPEETQDQDISFALEDTEDWEEYVIFEETEDAMESFVFDETEEEIENETENETEIETEDFLLDEEISEYMDEDEDKLIEDPEGEETEDVIEDLDDQDLFASKIEKYTYSIEPLLAPFNNFYYVKTDNPNPDSFRLIDKTSKFFSGEPNGIRDQYVIEQYKSQFVDVVYEKKATLRVKGGYIFYNYWGDVDGGSLTLQEASTDGWKDTATKISCPNVKDAARFLIDSYTNSSMSFFDKLGAIQNALNNMAVYPMYLFDSGKPNKNYPYAFLAASPYPELALNEHYEIYEGSDLESLVMDVYPFVLDSLAFPGIINAAAKLLDPSCTTQASYVHYLTTITYKGESRNYGGAGTGDLNPFFVNQCDRFFRFDQSSADLYKAASMNDLKELYWHYQEIARSNIQKNKDILCGDTFKNAIGSGSWVRVEDEAGRSGDAKTYAYIAHGPDDYYPLTVSNAWVDGRYINEYEIMESGASFSDHPTADIVVRNITYTDIDGNPHQHDIVYQYDQETDTWRAPYYYAGGWAYSSYMSLPDLFILTRRQVLDMKPDQYAGKWPERGLVYDGSEYPGTPFETHYITGISVDKSIKMRYYESAPLHISFFPKDAPDQTVMITSDNEKVVKISEFTSEIYATGIGTANVTVTSRDGNFKAVCKVTVKKRSIKMKSGDKVKIYSSKLSYGDPISIIEYYEPDFVIADINERIMGDFSFDNPKKILPVGTHTITWTFRPDDKNYDSVSGKAKIKVTKKDIPLPSAIHDQQYTGKAIKPALKIKNGSLTLKEGRDYKVTYWNNIEIGTAIGEITGIGNYTGTQVFFFEIKKEVKTTTSANTAKSLETTQKSISALKNDGDLKDSSFSTLKLKASKVKDTSITLKWGKVSKASGYILYGSKCGTKNKLKKLADIKKTSYTHKKLSKGTYYKYLVVAYRVSGGKKNVIASSKTIHVSTSGKKTANYKSVKLSKTKVSVGNGKSYTITAKPVIPNGKTVKKHVGLRYESSNQKIVTVTKKGVIKAKKKGKAYVYVYAQNGIYSRVLVTVK